MTDTRSSSETAEATLEQLQRLQRDAGIPHLPTQLTYECRLAVSKEGPRGYTWEDKPHRIVYDLCREIERINAVAQTQPAPCKQAYEVARHIIGYLEGNCGLSFFDLKQADWDAVTKLVATLALPSTTREAAAEKMADRWPLGCHSPNSCSRNGRCMYVGCRHDGKDIKALATAFTSTDRP